MIEADLQAVDIAKLQNTKNMSLQELLNSGQTINITIGLSDLHEFANDLIQKTKSDLEEIVLADKMETYPTREQVCTLLDVDQSTLWRWSKRGYLNPIEIGGKRRYRMSDVKCILNGGTK